MKRRSLFSLALALILPAAGITITPMAQAAQTPPPGQTVQSAGVRSASASFADASQPGTLAPGKDHICFVAQSFVHCSGKGADGQLGYGTTTDIAYGRKIIDNNDMMLYANVFRVASGENHSCMVTTGSKVYCWGDNTYGQLGDGSTGDRTRPTLVADNATSGFVNSNVSKVYAGHNHTCVIKGAAIFCWGRNDQGQLGDGTTTDSSLAVKVGGHFASTAPMGPMTLGGAHSCATSFSGNYELWCWGDNQYGQLGDGSNSDRLAPTMISASNVRNAQFEWTMAATEYSTCLASGQDGKVYCWGRNHKGQLGNGSTTDSNVPVVVTPTASFDNNGPSNKRSIRMAAGGNTVCAYMADSDATPTVFSINCWGSNAGGEIAGSTNVNNYETTPFPIPANANTGFNPAVERGNGNLAVSKNTTAGFACVDAWCWGTNTVGQIATGNTTNAALPTKLQVESLSGGGGGGGGGGSSLPALTGTVEEVAGPGIKVTVSNLSAGARLDVQVSPASFTPTGPNSEIPMPLTGAVDQNSVTVTSISWVSGQNPSAVIRTDSLQAGVPYRVGFSQMSGQGYGSLTFRTITLTGNVGSASGSTNASTPSTSATTGIVPGVTVTDSKVYTAAAPAKVASGSAISVLTTAQVKTQTLQTLSPGVCVPTADDIVFIDEGRCNVNVLSKRTGDILRRIRTTVIEDDVVDLGVGNEIVTLAPIYFDNGSSTLTRSARSRIAQLKSRISAAGTVMVIGHSGVMLGDTPENRALSRSRAVATVREMKRIRATGPFYSVGVGAVDPVVRSTDRADQAKNRRVVIVLIP